MAVPKHINSKYSAIIFEDTDNLIKARVSSTGTFSYSGLGVALKTTTVDITDTASKILGGSPLTNRNHIEIQNTSIVETLYVGTSSSVTADNVIGTTSGKEIPPGSYWNLDITDKIEVWAIAPTGKTIRIKITEVS